MGILVSLIIIIIASIITATATAVAIERRKESDMEMGLVYLELDIVGVDLSLVSGKICVVVTKRQLLYRAIYKRTVGNGVEFGNRGNTDTGLKGQ